MKKKQKGETGSGMEPWILTLSELELLGKRNGAHRLAMAIKLKYVQYHGRFPRDISEVSFINIASIAQQLNLSSDLITTYSWQSRVAQLHTKLIRQWLGIQRMHSEHWNEFRQKALRIHIPQGESVSQLVGRLEEYCQEHQIEYPSSGIIERHLHSCLCEFERTLFARIDNELNSKTKAFLDTLLEESPQQENAVSITQLKEEARDTHLETLTHTLSIVQELTSLPSLDHLFKQLSRTVLQKYRDRVLMERPAELRKHPNVTKYALLGLFCYVRQQELRDMLAQLLIQTLHKIGTRAERRIMKEFLGKIHRITGKADLLYRIAEVSLEYPDDVIRNRIYPTVGEETLKSLVQDYKKTGGVYQKKVQWHMRSSYGHHYRRALLSIIKALEFQASTQESQFMIAINLIQRYVTLKGAYYPRHVAVPINGVIPDKLLSFVQEGDKINRINYEIVVLDKLRDRLRCKEIWVNRAFQYRNPDEDLPSDFDERKTEYIKLLKQPHEAITFVTDLKTKLSEALHRFDAGLLKNKKVRIIETSKKNGKRNNKIKLTPLQPQSEPQNIAHLKNQIAKQWPSTSLLDILKETQLRTGFTNGVHSALSREYLSRDVLNKALLLCIYGLGTNIGIKRISNSNENTEYQHLWYVNKRYLSATQLRSAISKIVNATLKVRCPHTWGEGTTAVAVDSKHIRAWDQNLMCEWHARYGGRGIMIYWHVEKKATCIYSQLKRCSSSEVAAMIEGVLHHSTDMDVQQGYADTHGQNGVAFALTHLLNFELLPRLKNISQQKLAYVATEDSHTYKHITPILSNPVNWSLIEAHYDHMLKYATALRIGSASSEAILQRFSKNPIQHPVYKALLELGRVIKTIFICRYLHSERLRQEIQEGLNVVERWNGVNDFILYGKQGIVSTNQPIEQEKIILCLHLLQVSMVYINTLMLQEILSLPEWKERLTMEDKRALSPLLHLHINPYGLFPLDMDQRLSLAA